MFAHKDYVFVSQSYRTTGLVFTQLIIAQNVIKKIVKSIYLKIVDVYILIKFSLKLIQSHCRQKK